MNSNDFKEYTLASINNIIDGKCYILSRKENGLLVYSKCNSKNGIRPVFNTVDGIEFLDGTGSIKYPFIIKM